MRRVFGSVAAALAMVTCLGSTAFAQAIASPVASKGNETVRGQLVDRLCYTRDTVNNKGVDHKMPADAKNCAVTCVDAGQQLGLVTTDGKIYSISGGLRVNKYTKLVGHIGHTIDITGAVSGEGEKLTITADNFTMISK